jgi:hypothetical protein
VEELDVVRFRPHHRENKQARKIEGIVFEFCLFGRISFPGCLPIQELIQVFRCFDGLVTCAGRRECRVRVIDGR